MYKGLFDEKHRISQIDFTNKKESFPPTGIYEGNILCSNCDNKILGSYETYAAKELFKPTMHGFIEALKNKVSDFDGNETSVTMSRIEYKKAKLFFLSILWRASISSHRFFKFVNLEPTTSEKIRNMLYVNDSGKNDSFETSILAFIPDGNRPYFTIGAPRMIPFKEKQSYYAFVINSFVIFFNVSKENKNEIFSNNILNENGEMTIWILLKDYAQNVFDGLVGRDINHQGPFMQ